jgi:hypothetical protein
MSTTATPTAPLPPAAIEALSRLERGYASPADRLAARVARLSAVAVSSADFDRLLAAQDELRLSGAAS